MNRTRTITTTALLVWALALTGCGSEPVRSGTVTEKKFEAAEDECKKRKKNRCIKWEHDDADYELCVRDDANARRVECFEVEKDQYDAYTVGDRWPKNTINTTGIG